MSVRTPPSPPSEYKCDICGRERLGHDRCPEMWTTFCLPCTATSAVLIALCEFCTPMLRDFINAAKESDT